MSDPTDDVAVTRALLRRHDPAAGRIIVHPTPATATFQDLAHDLLAALGRPINRLGAEQLIGARRAWQAAAAWMQADRIADLVVLRADRLSPDGWGQLIAVCRHTGTRLTLICHTQPIPAPLADVLNAVDHQLLTAPAHLTLPAPPATGHPRDDHAADDRATLALPRLTYPGVVNYRAQALGQLGPADFARTDAVYQRARVSACTWLGTQPDPAGTQAGREAVMLFLTELVHDSPSRTHTLTRLRGAQAGFRRHGLKLTIPASRLVLDVLGGPGLTSLPVTAHLADRIRAGVAHPVLAAGVATASFTGIEPLALAGLHWASLTPDTDVLRATWTTVIQRPRARHPADRRASTLIPVPFHVPAAARPLLQAARHYTQTQLGDHAHRRLFEATPFSNQRIAVAAANCGLTLSHASTDLAVAWHSRIAVERVDYFGGPHDLDFAADQRFDPKAHTVPGPRATGTR